MKKSIFFSLIIIGAAATANLLSGCGQKGPLILPEQDTQTTEQQQKPAS